MGSPAGNGKAQSDAWSMSPDLKLQAKATALAEETIAKLRARGLTEDFAADVDALKKGVFTIQESALMVTPETSPQHLSGISP